jgi:hypothetical protein
VASPIVRTTSACALFRFGRDGTATAIVPLSPRPSRTKSPNTPTTRRQGCALAGWLAPIWKHWPIGERPGQIVRANVSLTMPTGSALSA